MIPNVAKPTVPITTIQFTSFQNHPDDFVEVAGVIVLVFHLLYLPLRTKAAIALPTMTTMKSVMTTNKVMTYGFFNQFIHHLSFVRLSLRVWDYSLLFPWRH